MKELKFGGNTVLIIVLGDIPRIIRSTLRDRATVGFISSLLVELKDSTSIPAKERITITRSIMFHLWKKPQLLTNIPL